MAEFVGADANVQYKVTQSGTWGNKSTEVFKHAVDDQNLAAADVLKIGIIPGPSTVTSLEAFFDAISAATGTVDIGFEAVDGSGFIDQAGTVADDPNYWADDLVTSAAGSDRSASKPLTIEKDVYVTVLANTAAMNQAATELFVVADYLFRR